MVGAKLNREVVRTRGHSRNPPLCATGRGRLDAATWKRHVAGHCSPPPTTMSRLPRAPKVLSGATSMLYAASSPEPPRVRPHSRSVRSALNPREQGVKTTGVGGTARHREVRGGGRCGDPNGPLRTDVDLSPVVIAKVGPEPRGAVDAIDPASAEIGGRVECEVGSGKRQEEAIHAIGLDVHAIDGDFRRRPLGEGGLVGARGDGEIRRTGRTEQHDVAPNSHCRRGCVGCRHCCPPM